jgi:hypothetical protein
MLELNPRDNTLVRVPLRANNRSDGRPVAPTLQAMLLKHCIVNKFDFYRVLRHLTEMHVTIRRAGNEKSVFWGPVLVTQGHRIRPLAMGKRKVDNRMTWWQVRIVRNRFAYVAISESAALTSG